MTLKRIGAAVATLMMAGGFVLAVAQPAAADATCPAQNFCAWALGRHEGTRWQTPGNDINWHDGLGGMAGDRIADDDVSWANNGSPCSGCDHVRVYRNVGYDAITLCIHRGQWVTIGQGGAAQNAGNLGSSHRWGGECGAGEPQIPG
ncbi:peptidase inhibitor family I36 protein [Actinoplanes sp. NBRC 103695]|uniref:peptidase inhibitor family I36 protein n=1 Tax=Actinoplanes sp. NBRC 103695 TaxID=3032202 RepID=UPI0024A58932|nr:peptidase inhibitor family I36 protein [Actinoplanes sp. NBRC 103695]GLY97572.1 hypothetical protein Acsp02_48260 [Actinoplanes sp. NBRC 103695]